jgi:cytochrome c
MQTGGNVKRGQQLIYSYNCGSCHTIPGVAEANGKIGPTLGKIAGRVYVAGLLVNTPENLSRWISGPQEIFAGTAMPDLGVTKKQADDIAAYLYTLR